MNSEKPLTPGEELEIRITAMLMGELSPDEAATLRGQLVESAELQALHDRLSNAFDLLRAAAPLGDVIDQSQPLRLSNERRERLLKRFKATAVRSPEITQIPRKRWAWLAPLSWAASFIVAVGILVWQLERSTSTLLSASGHRPEVAFSPPASRYPARPEPEFATASPVAINGQPAAEEPVALAFQAPPPAPATAAPIAAPSKPGNSPLASATPALGNKIDEANLRSDRIANYSGMPYYRGRGIEETGESLFKGDTSASQPTWESQPGAITTSPRSGSSSETPPSTLAGTIVPGKNGWLEVLDGAGRVAGRMALWNDDNSAKLNVGSATEGTFWDSKPADQQPAPASPATADARSLAATGVISDRERALVAEKEKTAMELAEAKAVTESLKVESDELKSSLGRLEDGLSRSKMATPSPSGPSLADGSARGSMFGTQPAPDAAARGEAPVAAATPAPARVIAGRKVNESQRLQDSQSTGDGGAKSEKPSEAGDRVQLYATGGIAGGQLDAAKTPQDKRAPAVGQSPSTAGGARGYAGKAMGGAEIAVSKAKSPSDPVLGAEFESAAANALAPLEAFDADQNGKDTKPAAGPQPDSSRKVKELLLQADGLADTGRLDLAKNRLDQVLATDPFNADARRELERIGAEVKRYAISGYNETRSSGKVQLEAAAEKPAQDFTADFAGGEDFTATGRQDWQFKQDGTLAKLGDAVDSKAPGQKPAEPVLGLPVERPIILSKEVDAPMAAPKAVAPIPQPEVATNTNAFSTFSLNVSDVSFKLAAASLEQGKLPDPAAIRSEEFINAFDYRDPEPSGSAPLAFVQESAHYPFAQNRDLLRFSVKTAAAGRQPGRPLNLVLLVDNSGSMERADRVRILRESLRVLAAQLQPQDKLSIITFARAPHLWVDGVPGNQAGEAAGRVGEITPEGGTNLSAALDLAYETARKHYQVANVNRVVLLTDGAANLGDVKPQALKQKVEAQRKQGIALDCFGIGWEGYNDDLLEQLSRNGDGRYGFINSPDEAATEFAGQLAGALRVAASDVKVQVEFNPKRITAYRQVGYAKHQLTKEQFRDNTVDAAEIGAAESGNALYVVEVNPRGEGDMAIVRARFKVPGTTDYREQEWTVPFSSNAPALEQASPSMRLAATASAFSESLAGNPYAAEVSFDRLLGLINGVPSAFGTDPRPQKLEWMIRQAKSVSGR